MTVYEKTRALFNEMKLNYEVFTNIPGSVRIALEVNDKDPLSMVRGYSGFTTEFWFNLDGSFDHVEIWE